MGDAMLHVEVVSGLNLLAAGGGPANAFVELKFQGQRRRTDVKPRDSNPRWNHRFTFHVQDPSRLSASTSFLEASVYHASSSTAAANSSNKSSATLIGRIRISPDSIITLRSSADSNNAAVQFYPLKSAFAGLFSWPRSTSSSGEGGLALRAMLTGCSYSTEEAAAAGLRDPSRRTTLFRSIGRNGAPSQQPHPRSTSSSWLGGWFSTAAVTHGNRWMPPPQAGMPGSEFKIEETNPELGGNKVLRGMVIPVEKVGTYDLVKTLQLLYVRVVRAKELKPTDCDSVVVEVRLGNIKGETQVFERNPNPEWREVFAFSASALQSTFLEVALVDKRLIQDTEIGTVRFELNEVPKRVPPDSPLAPQWYQLLNPRTRIPDHNLGELMLAVWFGTQADECFAEAIQTDEVNVNPSLAPYVRSKVYHAPRLWYLRVQVMQAEDIYLSSALYSNGRSPNVIVVLKVGNQRSNTKNGQRISADAYRWNEEQHWFVVAEPLEDSMIEISVIDRVAPDKDEKIAAGRIAVSTASKRSDKRPIRPKWENLHRPGFVNADQLQQDAYAAKIQLQLVLEGGYHVVTEPVQYSSDLRPSSKELSNSHIGVLELGILDASGLMRMHSRDGRDTCDAYCMAKYGGKWVRTRTVVDSLTPQFQEQYSWLVHDHATVLTVAVFHNVHISNGHGRSGINGRAGATAGSDICMGKVRIRLSTLSLDRVYTHIYPLIVLDGGNGLRKMGNLHLAIRFSATNWGQCMYTYFQPHLPKMHYTHAIPHSKQDVLRGCALTILMERFSHMEPPIDGAVVKNMCDARVQHFSLRRIKANYHRIEAILRTPMALYRWFANVCAWKDPAASIWAHIVSLIIILVPRVILPTFFLHIALVCLWNLRRRPRNPPHMNVSISHADRAHPDELDEEVDTIPSSRPPDVVRMRYLTLREKAGGLQKTMGDLVMQGERLHSLVYWKDKQATGMLLVLCIFMFIVTLAFNFKTLAVLSGFWLMRHPKLRNPLPSIPKNFFRRLPARTDQLL